eukprot:6199502-Pleurochrysis_carterae.AAC.1
MSMRAVSNSMGIAAIRDIYLHAEQNIQREEKQYLHTVREAKRAKGTSTYKAYNFDSESVQ